jgi:hypothetical protein
MRDKIAEQCGPFFPAKPVFCKWNFRDPLATKAGNEKQGRRRLAVNAISGTASVSLATDWTWAFQARVNNTLSGPNA